MSRLVDLYSDDGRVVVGRSATPYPVSVGVGFGIVGQLVTGYAPITSQIQNGWRNVKTGALRFNLGAAAQRNTRVWTPNYTTVTTGYAPVYSPVFGAVYSPLFGIY